MQCPYCKEDVLDGALKCKHCGSAIGSALTQSGAAAAAGFGEMFSAAANLWKANLGDLAVLTLVLLLVGWIPIANLGFIAGYSRSVMKVARGQGKAQVGDLFGAWDCFGNLLVYAVVTGVACFVLNFVPFLGQLAALALGFVAAPGLYAVIDQNRGAIDALKWSLSTVQAHFADWLLVYVVAGVLTFAGFAVLLVGSLLTLPLGGLLWVQQYDRVKQS